MVQKKRAQRNVLHLLNKIYTYIIVYIKSSTLTIISKVPRTLAASGHGGDDCPGRTMRQLSGMIKLFYILREVWGTQVYTSVISNHTIELRSVPFNVCKLIS